MSEKNKYKGKDVEEAIAMACENLDVSRDKLNIEIVSPGSKGIFGLGRKKAVILVSKKGSSRATTDSTPKKVESRAQKKTGKITTDIPLLKKKSKKID
nr:Jag N-terminal domain-containing protein [Desulfobulbaceae bacterium]